MKQKLYKRILPINLYIIFTVLNMVIWWFIPELEGFLGGSSPVYVFVLCVGLERFWISILGIAWILAFFISIIVFYILARKYNKYILFIVLVGIDLLISLPILLVYIISIINGYSANIFLRVGWYVLSIIYYIWMVNWVYKKEWTT